MRKALGCLLFAILLIIGCHKEKPLPHNNNLTQHELDSIYQQHQLDSIIHQHELDSINFQPPVWPMIKTIIFYNADNTIATTLHYYYDWQWRLIRYTDDHGASHTTANYSYAGSIVSVNGNPQFYLNSSNLLDYEYAPNGNYYYVFGADSFLNNVHSSHSNSTNYYDAGPNVSVCEQFGSGGLSYANARHDFVYNNQPNTIGNYNMGKYYLGKSTINLVVEDHAITYHGSDTIFNFTLYSYTYNTSGWVNRVNATYGNVNKIVVDSVTTIMDTTYSSGYSDYTYY